MVIPKKEPSVDELKAQIEIKLTKYQEDIIDKSTSCINELRDLLYVSEQRRDITEWGAPLDSSAVRPKIRDMSEDEMIAANSEWAEKTRDGNNIGEVAHLLHWVAHTFSPAKQFFEIGLDRVTNIEDLQAAINKATANKSTSGHEMSFYKASKEMIGKIEAVEEIIKNDWVEIRNYHPDYPEEFEGSVVDNKIIELKTMCKKSDRFVETEIEPLINCKGTQVG